MNQLTEPEPRFFASFRGNILDDVNYDLARRAMESPPSEKGFVEFPEQIATHIFHGVVFKAIYLSLRYYVDLGLMLSRQGADDHNIVKLHGSLVFAALVDMDFVTKNNPLFPAFRGSEMFYLVKSSKSDEEVLVSHLRSVSATEWSVKYIN